MPEPKTTAPAVPQAPTVSVAPDIELSLTEFCVRLSTTVKQVEIIGGFEHAETAAGRLKDTEPAYRERYVAFCNKPVY